MQPAASLGELIDSIAPGDARLALPRDATLDLPGLVRAPRACVVAVRGDDARRCITPALRALATMRDPVADAHAGWLLAVVCIAAGITPEHDDALPPSSDAKLTAEGRAWLVQQAIECATTDEQRDAVLAAVRA